MFLIIIPFSKKSKENQAARNMLNIGKPEEALKIFKKINSKTGIMEVGNYYFKRKNLSKASKIYFQAGYNAGLEQIATEYLERENFSGAEKTYKLIYGSVPVEIYNSIGKHFMERGVLASAEKAYRKSSNNDGMLMVGIRYYEKNDLSNALRIFRQFGRKDKIRLVAREYLNQGKLETAEKLFYETDDQDGLSEIEDIRKQMENKANKNSVSQ